MTRYFHTTHVDSTSRLDKMNIISDNRQENELQSQTHGWLKTIHNEARSRQHYGMIFIAN